MTQIDPVQSALFENVRKPKAAQKTIKDKEKGKGKHAEVSAPVFGIKSSPGFAPGLKNKDDSATSLAFEHLPFPKLGVERGFTTPTARHNANTLAKTVAESSGTLTDEGRAALMGYSGGGGLGESLTAFYTPTPLAAYVWALVSNLHDGRLKSALEPACGVGAFLMTAPAGVRVTGVEYDTLTATIASLLNPHTHVHNLTFENFTTTSVDPFVDVVVGNPPFGDRGRLSGHRGLEGSREDRHEWFFLNSALSRVKPGGIVAMIVPEDLVRESAYTERRRKLLGRATVLGVIGVPTGAFAASNAGVMTVILVLRRHDQGVEAGLKLLNDRGSTETNDKGETILLPGERETMLRTLGTWARPFVEGHTTFMQKGKEWVSTGLNVAEDTKVTHSRFGDPQLSGKIHLDQARLDHHLANLKAKLDTAVSRSALLSAVRAEHGPERETQVQLAMRRAPTWPIPNSFTSEDGLFRFSHGSWQHADLINTPEAQTAILLARELTAERLSNLRSPKRDELTAQLALHDDGKQGERLAKMAARYPLLHVVRMPPAPPALDTRATLLPGALEDVAEQLADLHLLTLRQLMAVSGEDQQTCEAHLLSEYRFSGESTERRWIRKGDSDFGHAYDRAGTLRTQAQGFSGVEAESLLKQADDFETRALAQWKSLPDCDLTPRDSVVPAECLEAWLDAYLNLEGDRAGAIEVSREGGIVSLRLRYANSRVSSLDQSVLDSGTVKGIESYLNYATKRDMVNRQDKSREEIRAQEAAALKRASRYERGLEAHWRNWMVTSSFAADLENRYNRARNAVLTAPEDVRAMNIDHWKGPKLHLYQRRDVRTLAAWGHGVLNYDVGLGKTFSALALLSLLKTRREARMAMLVTPLSLTGNWVTNVRRARPDWKVMSIGMTPTGKLDDFGEPEYGEDNGKVRQEKLASLMSDPPDLVIISIETFVDIPMSHDTLIELIEEDAGVMAAAKQAAADGYDDRKNRFGGHKQAVTFESEVGDMLDRSKVSTGSDLTFEMLGVDLLIFEESHKMKNLWSAPQYLGEVPKFMGAGMESRRALAAYHKARYVRKSHQGRGTYALTATPWKNSPLECMYALALVTDDLRAYGLDTPMSFMLRYCEIEQQIITSPDGEVGLRNCVMGFKNLAELEALIRGHVISENAMDCRMDEGTGLPLPKLEKLVHTLALTPEQAAAYNTYRSEAANPDRKGENHLFAILSRMEAAIIDPVNAGIGGRNPRASLAAKLAAEEHTRGFGTVTFLDRGGDAEDGAYGVYVDAYVRAGIPRERIEVVTAKSHPTPASRMRVEARYARGELRHVLGGSIIREGFNLQHYTAAIINLDQPHDPEDKTQRTGRGWRQGNLAPYVKVHDLLAVGSSDALRYTNLMGKAGWIAALRSGSDRAVNHAAFDAIGVALLLNADPEAAKKAIAEKMQALTEDAARAEQAHALTLVRSFAELVSLTRQRWEKANGRENGPSKQDKAGLDRMAGQLITLARSVSKLPAELRQVLNLKRRPEWVHHLPLVPGLKFTLGTKAVVFERTAGARIYASRQVISADELQDAVDVVLPEGEANFGPCLTQYLPKHIREGVEAVLTGGEALTAQTPETQIEELLPELPGQEQEEPVQAEGLEVKVQEEVTPDIVIPVAQVSPPAPVPPVVAPQEKLTPEVVVTASTEHAAPSLVIRETYAVSVRRTTLMADMLYRVEDNKLVSVAFGSIPQPGETLMALYGRHGLLKEVALIVSPDRHKVTVSNLRARPDAFRARITALLARNHAA